MEVEAEWMDGWMDGWREGGKIRGKNEWIDLTENMIIT